MWNQLSKRHLRQRAGRSEMPLIFWGWATQSRTNKSGRAVKQQLQDTKALALTLHDQLRLNTAVQRRSV